MRTVAILLSIAGCSKPATEARPAPQPSKVTPPSAPALDLPGDSNGIFWDAASATLYLTDDTHDQIVKWTDAGGFGVAASLPPAPKVSLGGLVRLADGSFVVTSFGFGTDGAVLTTTGSVPALDRTRRRLGLAVGADGALYDAYFVVDQTAPPVDGAHRHHGGVARLDLAGHETDLDVPGLAKAIGVAVTATTLYVSDQEQGTVYAYDLGSHAVTRFASQLPSADLLTVLPGGDLVTGGKKGEVYRIGHDGKVTTLASGFEQVRGTAYDPAKRRLFVIEHSAASSRHRLHIIAL